MGAYQKIDPGFAEAIAGALDWWAAAGVDTLVDDETRDWFAAAPPRATAAAPVEQPAGVLPGTIEAFATWRIGPDAPEAGWSGVSLAASGPAHAEVMVLVDCPEREDGDAGALLSGAAGRLFDRMLAAIGLTREAVHLAAVCARRPAAGRMPREIEARLAEVSRHLVELAAPKRLLLLGEATSRALLAADRASIRGSLQPFNHKNGQTLVVATHHPRLLLERPALKTESWRDLQLLMGFGE